MCLLEGWSLGMVGRLEYQKPEQTLQIQGGVPFLSTHWIASFPVHRRRCLIARKKANWPESKMLSRSSLHPITGKNSW